MRQARNYELKNKWEDNDTKNYPLCRFFVGQ